MTQRIGEMARLEEFLGDDAPTVLDDILKSIFSIFESNSPRKLELLEDAARVVKERAERAQNDVSAG